MSDSDRFIGFDPFRGIEKRFRCSFEGVLYRADMKHGLIEIEKIIDGRASRPFCYGFDLIWGGIKLYCGELAG